MEQEEDGCGDSVLPGPTKGSPPASLEPQTQTPVAAGLESPVVSTHTAHAPWAFTLSELPLSSPHSRISTGPPSPGPELSCVRVGLSRFHLR